MGIVERSAALVKRGLGRILSHIKNMSMEMAVRRSRIARDNLPLLSPNLTPSFLMFGKASIFEVVEAGVIPPAPTLSDTEDMHQRRMIGILRARNDMLIFDTGRAIRKCLRPNIRPHSGVAIKIGESSHAARQGKWTAGWRCLGLRSNNDVVGKDRTLIKAPYTMIRRNAEEPIHLKETRPESANRNSEPSASSGGQETGPSSSPTPLAQSDAEDIVRSALVGRSMLEQPLVAAG